MSDDRATVSDDVQEKVGDRQVRDGAEAKAEALGGMEQQADEAKKYKQDRANGLRDKDTYEIFGAQPELFDSQAALSQNKLPVETSGKVERDGDNRPSKITYPNGSSESVKYDGSGNPVEIRSNDNSFWRQDKDGWNHYDKGGKKDQHLDGTMEVNDKGDVIARENSGYTETASADGSLVKEFPDKSKVYIDKDQNITSVTHGDGSNTFFKYDDKGNPKEIQDVNPDGSVKQTWVKDNDRWSVRDKDGKEVDFLYGDVKVNNDGDIIRTGRDSHGNVETQTQRHDGSLRRELQDHSVIDTDAKGRLTHVKRPDGSTSDFKYDDKGKLSEFTDGKGVTYSREREGEPWHMKDKKGNDLGTKDGNYEAKPNGDIVWSNKDDSITDTTHANGTRDRIEWKGYNGNKHDSRDDIKSQTTWDEKGRITSDTYSGDQVKFFTYDRNGKLSAVSDRHPTDPAMHGDHWVKGSDGSWTEFDESGNVKRNPDGSRREAKNVEVKPNGDIVITNKDGTVNPPVHSRKF